MAKKQSYKKTTIKKTGGLSVFWNKHWQVILISVLVIGILGFIGVNKLIIYNQKQQFDQAEKSLDTLYANIVKDVGQPTSMNKDKSCSYASTEGGRGRLGCAITINSYFRDITTEDESLKLALKIEKLLENNSTVKVVRNIAQNNNTKIMRGDYDSSDDFKFFDQPKDCYISYLLNKNGSYSDATSFRVSFTCYGRAKAEFYPVKN